jgi:type II secretory pathway component PulL
MLAVGLLAAHVLVQSLLIHQANKQTAALDAEIAQVYSAAMPTVPLRDPRRQMQSRLDRIRRADGGPEYFLRTLRSLTSALAGQQKTSVDALSFRGQTLNMKVTAPNVAVLAQISQSVGRDGLTADIQSSTPVEGGVEAHLELRSQGARSPR